VRTLGGTWWAPSIVRSSPLRRTRFSSIWRPAAAAAGLGAEVTFHDLRHSSASPIQHGESVKVVQRRLGYKSAVETLDTYSHLWPDSEDRTREAVDQVLGLTNRAAAVHAPGGGATPARQARRWTLPPQR
jgi:integrase